MMNGSEWGHNMMGGNGFTGALLWIIILIDLILLGIWLWKQIAKR